MTFTAESTSSKVSSRASALKSPVEIRSRELSSCDVASQDYQTSPSSSWNEDQDETPYRTELTYRLVPVDGAFTSNQALAFSKHAQNSISRILSPSAERSRLYSTFIDTYLPQTQPGAQNGHFSFFQTIALKHSEQPALQESFDALSLVQIGSIHKDQTVLKTAVQSYTRALSSLGRSMAKKDFLRDDDVLAAMTVMATCELYEEIAKTGEGWSKHVSGSNQMLALRGPDSLQSDLALLLYSNMRHGALCHALIARKAPFMASEEWRAVAFRVPTAARDASTLFYDIAIQIPGLLERHDDLDLDSVTAIRDVDDLLAESEDLERKLREWFAGWRAWSTMSTRRQEIYETRPIEDFTTFTLLCDDTTLTHAYTFPDFLIAYLHSLYWMSLYYMRSNTQSLHQHRHKIDDNWYPSSEDVVPQVELFDYILHLCRCIPFFVEPVSSSTGSIGIFLPMRCAAMYFAMHGHWEWLKWIGSVRNSVFVKGLSPPSVKFEGSGKVSPGP